MQRRAASFTSKPFVPRDGGQPNEKSGLCRPKDLRDLLQMSSTPSEDCCSRPHKSTCARQPASCSGMPQATRHSAASAGIAPGCCAAPSSPMYTLFQPTHSCWRHCKAGRGASKRISDSRAQRQPAAGMTKLCRLASCREIGLLGAHSTSSVLLACMAHTRASAASCKLNPGRSSEPAAARAPSKPSRTASSRRAPACCWTAACADTKLADCSGGRGVGSELKSPMPRAGRRTGAPIAEMRCCGAARRVVSCTSAAHQRRQERKYRA